MARHQQLSVVGVEVLITNVRVRCSPDSCEYEHCYCYWLAPTLRSKPSNLPTGLLSLLNVMFSPKLHSLSPKAHGPNTSIETCLNEGLNVGLALNPKP